jgi:hypothetical protein
MSKSVIYIDPILIMRIEKQSQSSNQEKNKSYQNRSHNSFNLCNNHQIPSKSNLNRIDP